MKIFLIAGARPNYVKVAALWKAYKVLKHERPAAKIQLRLINTGQHYDYLLSKKLFRDFNLPSPYVDLEVGSGTHGVQTARIMQRFEKLLFKERPDLVMVVGDVNSTMACSLVAAKMRIPIAHVESGLRSYDRTMPEEINRIVTDALSDILFTSCRDGNHNLENEGVCPDKIHFVGNVMVDTLLTYLPKADKSKIKKKLSLIGDYGVLTLHRPSNVDRDSDFAKILKPLGEILKRIKIVFPVHPRTQARIQKSPLSRELKAFHNLIMVPPAGYLDFINLLRDACLVLTDSGGIQEETTVLGIPCLTLRPNTERPVTIHEGTNVLVGSNGDLAQMAFRILDGKKSLVPRRPELWDGKSSNRIFEVLSKKFGF